MSALRIVLAISCRPAVLATPITAMEPLASGRRQADALSLQDGDAGQSHPLPRAATELRATGLSVPPSEGLGWCAPRPWASLDYRVSGDQQRHTVIPVVRLTPLLKAT